VINLVRHMLARHVQKSQPGREIEAAIDAYHPFSAPPIPSPQMPPRPGMMPPPLPAPQLPSGGAGMMPGAMMPGAAPQMPGGAPGAAHPMLAALTQNPNLMKSLLGGGRIIKQKQHVVDKATGTGNYRHPNRRGIANAEFPQAGSSPSGSR